MREPEPSLRIGTLVASILSLLLLSSLRCGEVEAVQESPVERESVEKLVEYLKIDTSNPPGNETRAAQYFKQIFEAEGIEAQLVGSDPTRQSIYARLRSGSSEPALLLLHHIDVVPANAGEWSVPPFSGQQSGGYIWGRGALDIKSLGIAGLMAFLDLHRSARPLRRDVVFLGVADEEAGGLRGALALLDTRPDLFEGVGFVLNEGGANETVVDQVTYWGIEVNQKVPLWLRITARAEPGHGAVPPQDGGAIIRLIDALERIRTLEFPDRLTPIVRTHFRSLARVKAGLKKEILLDPERFLANPELEKSIPGGYRALLRGTVAFTQLSAGSSANAVPASASATIDIRLLPDESSAEVLQRIRDLIGDQVDIEVLLDGVPSPDAPVDTELYRLLETAMRKAEPRSIVGPIVTAGTTDSRFFRSRGIVAYGISPFRINYYDGGTVHGTDERIRSGFFVSGVNLMVEIVREFCARTE